MQKIKQMKSTNIKLWNLPCLKVNGLSSFIHKSKELMGNNEDKCPSQNTAFTKAE